jgi:RNA polymerase sigma factor (sigma-70 family)
LTLFLENRPLLNAFRHGDTQALGRVYTHYFSQVEQIIRHGFFEKRSGRKVPGVSERHSRTEVIHDVFVNAFSPNTRTSYDGVRPYIAFLRMITRNTLVDYWRKRTREPIDISMGTSPFESERMLHGEAAGAASFPLEVEEDLHWKRCLDECEIYVSSLSLALQRLVQLRFREKHGQIWVAEAMGVSRWRVRAMEKHVTTGLRKHLKRKKLLT